MRGGLLHFWVLRIIVFQSMNGSEIIREIEKRTGGHWRPSPGSVYPLLSSMESKGEINKTVDGKYAVTEKGKAVYADMNRILEGFISSEDPDDVIEETLYNIRFIREGIGTGHYRIEDLGGLIEECKKIVEALKNGGK